MDLKIIIQAIDQIAEEKGINPTRVTEAIENSLAAAYRREYLDKGANVKAKLDQKTGDVEFFRVKEVVDDTTVRMEDDEDIEGQEGEVKSPKANVELNKAESKDEVSEEEEERLPRYNPERHLLLEEAIKDKEDVELGEEIESKLPAQTDFSRIAAQNAKQVILQNLREAERESISEEFQDREGKIISGVVQRFERGNVYIDLGRTTGAMFANESIPGEHYRVGERLRFYIVAVQREVKGPGTGIVLSRSHPNFVGELFVMEIPEIADGVVEIKAIVREPGSRTKIAVASNVEEIDPVGSCVGQRGTRIMAISNELGQEKIDVVEWSEDPEELIANALSPAKIRSVEVKGGKEAKVLVADDQLSLAIGRGGQNVRLAAKLTNLKIDVRSQARPDEELESGIADVEDEVIDESQPEVEEVKEKEVPKKAKATKENLPKKKKVSAEGESTSDGEDKKENKK